MLKAQNKYMIIVKLIDFITVMKNLEKTWAYTYTELIHKVWLASTLLILSSTFLTTIFGALFKKERLGLSYPYWISLQYKRADSLIRISMVAILALLTLPDSMQLWLLTICIALIVLVHACCFNHISYHMVKHANAAVLPLFLKAVETDVYHCAKLTWYSCWQSRTQQCVDTLNLNNLMLR